MFNEIQLDNKQTIMKINRPVFMFIFSINSFLVFGKLFSNGSKNKFIENIVKIN